jgi:hypothetical protein
VTAVWVLAEVEIATAWAPTPASSSSVANVAVPGSSDVPAIAAIIGGRTVL